MSINNIANDPVSLDKNKLNKLSQKKIYFGHMSVGYNIIEGINDIIKDIPNNNLNIIETKNKVDFKKSIFAHSKIGENTKPKSKIDAFSKLMSAQLGNNVDYGFFKLCYIDINQDTDVKELFDYYKAAMNRLITKFPKTRFIHFTAPLTSQNNGGIKSKIKDLIKSIIGKTTGKEKNTLSNIKRNKFNELIRKEYDNRFIFDLAEHESTYPGGSRESFKKDTNSYYTLIPEYTNDGGHLNELGRRVVAKQLVYFLINIR